ncbi:hypothetical protein [Streptomyces sp. NPDC012510]|uniref:hypothetical protein n=1 Tax=Streptomyces sp. NPDC012510 TaxID=3364838 RepID=UPI0036EFDD3E
MPESMEGVTPEAWRRLVAHEYAYRAALEEAHRRVRAELDRPRERYVSHLGVTVVGSFVFGVITVCLFALGFGWWSLLPVALLVPALVLAAHFARRVLRLEGTDGSPPGRGD